MNQKRPEQSGSEQATDQTEMPDLDKNQLPDETIPLMNAASSFPQEEPAVYEWNFSDYEAIERAGQYTKTKHSRGLIMLSVFLSLSLIAVITMFCIYAAYNNQSSGEVGGIQNQENGPNLILNDAPSTDTQNTDDGEATSKIASDVMPSVVGIVTYDTSESYDPVGQGSGVIMSEEGYIVTNAHVLLDSNDYLLSTISVVLQNQDEYEATLVGIDVKTDLAVIKIDAKGLVPAEFGNSDQVQVGDRVIAIGNPGGVIFMGSVSQGIVSGLNRTVKTDTGLSLTLLQTDAAINPGNSGGPLVNRYGQVIGINSAKIRQSDYEGIGFSLPINTVKPVVDDLIQYGYVQNRVKIGITYQEVDSVLSKANNTPAGLYVIKVEQGMSAAQNGLKAGDTITTIDGQSIDSAEGLNQILEQKQPGDTIVLMVYRGSSSGNSSTLEITVTLAEDTGEVQESPGDNSSQSQSSDEEDDSILTIKHSLGA